MAAGKPWSKLDSTFSVSKFELGKVVVDKSDKTVLPIRQTDVEEMNWTQAPICVCTNWKSIWQVSLSGRENQTGSLVKSSKLLLK